MCNLVFDGRAVRRMREARKWTRDELSARSLVSTIHIKRIENRPESWDRVKPITVQALARALECDVEAFAGTSAEPTSDVA